MKLKDVQEIRLHVQKVAVSQLEARSERQEHPKTRKRKADEISTPTPSSSPQTDSSSSSVSVASCVSTSPKPLTLEQETALRYGYEKQIWEICGVLHLPTSVKATATTFFKRFYLYNSVMDQDPELMLLMCIFLATKTEEQWTKIEKLAELVSREPSDIISLEVPLLEGMKFSLYVYHPYRPLNGFMSEMKAQELAAPADLLPAAHAFIEACLRSDAIFVFSPSVIALCALVHSARAKGLDSVDRYLSSHFGTRPDFKQLLQSISDLDSYVCREREKNNSVTKKALKKIVRKLKKCRNPTFIKDSPEYKAAEAVKESEWTRVHEAKCERVAKQRQAELATLFEPRPGVDANKEFVISFSSTYNRPGVKGSPADGRSHVGCTPRLDASFLPPGAMMARGFMSQP